MSCLIVIGSIISFTFAGVVGINYLTLSANADTIQESWEGTVYCSSNSCDVMYYDTLPRKYFPDYYSSGNISDAQHYMREIDDFCGDDRSCQDNGNRFSFIYTFNSTTMLLLAVDFALMTFGLCS